MVQMTEHAPIPELRATREKLHLPSQFEFRFHKTTMVQKETFFKTVQTVPFRVRALVLDKSRMPEQLAGLNGQALMIELIVGLTFRASPLDIANDVLIIDGGTPALCRALRVRLSEECRKMKRVRPFSKVVGGRSRSEDGLQLADMIAGAIRQNAMGSDSSHYQTFAGKIVDIWEVSTRISVNLRLKGPSPGRPEDGAQSLS